jgi:DNA-binding transcriptional LysR family regulator
MMRRRRAESIGARKRHRFHERPDIWLQSDHGETVKRTSLANREGSIYGSTARWPGCCARQAAPTSYYAPSLRSPWRVAEDYIYIEWGPGFYAQHAQSYPDLERPPQIANIGWLGIQLALANGGSCFLPVRMAAPFIAAGRLHRVPGSPEYAHPAYLVYPRESDNPVLALALEGLRELAARELGARHRQAAS